MKVVLMKKMMNLGRPAALLDDEWLAHVIGSVENGRDRIAEVVSKHGLFPLPSATNFVTVDCGKGGDFARALLAELIGKCTNNPIVCCCVIHLQSREIYQSLACVYKVAVFPGAFRTTDCLGLQCGMCLFGCRRWYCELQN